MNAVGGKTYAELLAHAEDHATAAPAPEAPPPPERIVEALLFAGGQPLSAERAGEVIRGLTPPQFRAAIDELTRNYRRQNRPYTVRQGEQGFFLALRPAYNGMRERLFGGPREARLTGAALDVLAVIAYQQPVTLAEVDSLRGSDSAAAVRQLVRLGLAAVETQEPGKDATYVTTPRFLELFGLKDLNDLPRTMDLQQM